MNISRVRNFLKKDKRYIARRLWQELFFRINKWRYLFPVLLIKKYKTKKIIFFRPIDITSLKFSKQVIEAADKVMQQKFDLLGSGEVHLAQIDWSKDFKSNFVWEKKYCHDYDYNDLDLPNDVKVPWELSRLQFLPCLSQAYIITNDQKYVEKLEWYLRDWQKNNPFARSINWTCTMDVALRTISVLLAFDLLKAHKYSSESLKKWDDFLYLHGVFINENLEKSDINGNHYLADLVGLLFVGAYFTKHEWIDKALVGLEEEILLQTHEDGSDFEGSVPYHRLVLELFYLAFQCAEMNGLKFSSRFNERLKQMFHFVSRYIDIQGSIPVIGDNDNGRAFILGNEDLNDHRYLLEIGQAIFKSESILSLSISSDYYVWLGHELPEVKKSFPETWLSENYFVSKSADSYFFLEFSPIGLGGRGGHGHSDTGSFVLSLMGKSLVVDTGCYAYTSDFKRRNVFRSTEAHNIIQIDNKQLFPFLEERNLWHLKNTIRHRKMTFNNDELTLSHDGYGCGYERIVHKVNELHWVIRDNLTGLQNQQKITSRFHLHPSVECTLIDDKNIEVVHSGKRFLFSIKNEEKIALNIESCEISFQFGKLENSKKILLTYSIGGKDSFEFEYELKAI